ncbi:MaoC domain protein dehydratase [Mycolicibacterium rhodesiae JS60]|nr:MaoC domain protein dehydratase [Mycolicibacterium rhodesiae JS60]
MTAESPRVVVGAGCGEHAVVIDRAPVQNFAAVLDDVSPLYRDSRVAREAGFSDVPAPPTYPFVMLHWGIRDELLDEHGVEAVPGNPFTGVADQLGHVGLVMAQMIDELGPGVVLHAEQGFEYHRTPVVGDVLRGASRIADEYTKASRHGILTFVVIETVWTDAVTSAPVLTTRFTAVHQPRNNIDSKAGSSS